MPFLQISPHLHAFRHPSRDLGKGWCWHGARPETRHYGNAYRSASQLWPADRRRVQAETTAETDWHDVAAAAWREYWTRHQVLEGASGGLCRLGQASSTETGAVGSHSHLNNLLIVLSVLTALQRTASLARPYFRDWGNLKYQEGKSFIAPPRLFRADMSLFFPNLFGKTLVKTDKEPRDTTPRLLGKASVVTIFSSQWAENQVNTFISKEANPDLHDFLAQEESQDRAQLVSLHTEDNAARAWLVKMFSGSLRRKLPEKDWDKYFLVRGGITDHIRESIGLLNSKVGYTYLVDQYCRIRWAGSGPSEPEERAGLVKGLRRLVQEMQKDALLPASAREQRTAKRFITGSASPESPKEP